MGSEILSVMRTYTHSQTSLKEMTSRLRDVPGQAGTEAPKFPTSVNILLVQEHMKAELTSPN